MTRCTICNHKDRHAIEIALTHKVSGHTIAKRFDVSAWAVLRHARSHLTDVQRAAIMTAQPETVVDLDKLKVTESEGLLTQLVTQRARLQQIAEKAIGHEDIKGAVAAEGAITRNLDLVGRLLGQFQTTHNVRTTSVLVSPDYLKMRALLVEALRPFPDASVAVSAVLHRMESEAAKDITESARPAPPLVIDHEPTVPLCPIPSTGNAHATIEH